MPEKDSGKLIANRIEQKQRAENIRYFRHKEIYQSLLLEYGLSDKYVDYRSPYAALSHSYYGQWSPHGRAWRIRVKDGTSRAPLGNVGAQKNDYTVLEIEWRF